MSVESVELLRRENERKILQAVKKLLNESNPSELSLGRIAQQAGVAIKTINNIFGTKNSLLIRTGISAYTAEHAALDKLVAGAEFAEKSGLEQVLALHTQRAKLQRDYPYVARVVSEIERLRITSETEIRQCEQYLALVNQISSYYDAPIQKGHLDGSIQTAISREEMSDILFFSFGAITQKLQSVSLNDCMNRRVDSYSILRTVLKMTKEYIGG